jgi:hypothetical protein
MNLTTKSIYHNTPLIKNMMSSPAWHHSASVAGWQEFMHLFAASQEYLSYDGPGAYPWHSKVFIPGFTSPFYGQGVLSFTFTDSDNIDRGEGRTNVRGSWQSLYFVRYSR